MENHYQLEGVLYIPCAILTGLLLDALIYRAILTLFVTALTALSANLLTTALSLLH